jgi:hypothetical protein
LIGHRKETLPKASRLNAWLWVLSLFLVGLGARLWLIQRFGTPLPFWDQWEEARVVYLPFFQGKLTLADLFSAHNEHRILFTRLYSLGLLLLNGQWDGQLQMVVNAIVHCATMVWLGALMGRWVETRHWWLLWLPLAAALALPFGWENSLAGFQSQFYFLVVFSLVTLWLLGTHPPNSLRWWCGVATGILALFTVASGFLAAAAAFSLAVLRVWRRPQSWKQEAPTLTVCAALVVAGLLLKVDVRHHHLLQAHSVGEFLTAFANNLAWPWIVIPPFALFNLLPLAALGWWCFRQAEKPDPAAEMTLALGLWTALQGAAAAYARGADGRPPGWRYMDSSCFILVANCFSIAVLLSHQWPARTASGKWVISLSDVRSLIMLPSSCIQGSLRPILLTLFVLWGCASAIGLVLLTSRAWQIDIPERAFYHRAQLQHTRAFMATDDIHVFDGKPKPQLISYEGNPLVPPLPYDAEWTVNYLRNPRIRDILPACARLPLDILPNPGATQGFVTNGCQLARSEPRTEVSWGSCSAQGPAGTGTFESLPIRKSRFPYLEIPVAGDLGARNLSLELVDLATGRRSPVTPSGIPGRKWLNCYVKAPAGEFKIVARDNSDTGWFAFKPPREVGRLSVWAIDALSTWKYLLFAGLGLFLFNLSELWGRRRSADL